MAILAQQSYDVTVTCTTTDTPLGVGVNFGGTTLTVTDSGGTVQTFHVLSTGTTPWTQAVTVAMEGASTYSAQDVDSNGNSLGAAVTANYNPGVVGSFPATTGPLTVTAAGVAAPSVQSAGGASNTANAGNAQSSGSSQNTANSPSTGNVPGTPYTKTYPAA